MMDHLSVSVIAAFGGIQAILTSLLAFLGKVWLTRIHDRERANLETNLEAVKSQQRESNQQLQAFLDKTLHAQRLQIEKEFISLEAIWSSLVDLRSKTMQLRPKSDHIDPKESKDERKEKRYNEFYESHKHFSAAVEKNRPFFAAEIYEKLLSLNQVIQSEADDYWFLDPEEDRRKYWERATDNREKILVGIEEVCNAIRLRVVL